MAQVTLTHGKILPASQLGELGAALRAEGKRLVHCHGVFDLLHPGHIRHLHSARREGDVLVVTVTADLQVNKGPGRPIFNEALRAESIAALECTDFVAISEGQTAVEIIHTLMPHVYVKGSEYAQREADVTGKINDEEQAILTVGGRIHFTDDITFSSSHLINQAFPVLPPATEEWLRGFRQRRSADEVLRYLDGAAPLRTLVVGEAIIDEYVFCSGLGKSTKDPILAFQYNSTEAYAGGSLAVANHAASFCKEVGLVTLIGDRERREDFLRSSLAPNVKPMLLTRRGAPTIHKRRFVDTHTGARMFELYIMDDTPLCKDDDDSVNQTLRDVIRGYDVVIVADYGHGMMMPSLIGTLAEQARFLTLNTQTNAGNRGFNTITKYPRADYVCLAMHEVAIEARMRHAGAEELILEVTKRLDCERFTVTQGRSGSIHYDPQTGFTHVPALATTVTDRVGAGDAVLAVTPLLVVQGADWEISGFIGNLAGAQMVAELGNRTTISKASIAKHAISLMK